MKTHKPDPEAEAETETDYPSLPRLRYMVVDYFIAMGLKAYWQTNFGVYCETQRMSDRVYRITPIRPNQPMAMAMWREINDAYVAGHKDGASTTGPQ